MPYFPSVKEMPSYNCPGCRRWFTVGNVSCCVAHSPGSCCHHYEQEVPMKPFQDYANHGGGVV